MKALAIIMILTTILIAVNEIAIIFLMAEFTLLVIKLNSDEIKILSKNISERRNDSA